MCFTIAQSAKGTACHPAALPSCGNGRLKDFQAGASASPECRSSVPCYSFLRNRGNIRENGKRAGHQLSWYGARAVDQVIAALGIEPVKAADNKPTLAKIRCWKCSPRRS